MSVFGIALRRFVLLAVLLSLAAAANAQERVGVNSAVNTDATGTPPNGASRRLVIGENVVFNERIQTSPSGQTQVMFIDESTMTIGPNSDVTIDQFVYDPRAGTGTMALSVGRGVLRLVGGKLTKQDNPATVRTANAVVALRGGIMVADAHQGERLDAGFLFGKSMTVTGTNGVSQTVTAPGFGITVEGRGVSPSVPYRLPPTVLTGILARLDGRASGNGGARNIPTDTTVAASGVDNTISANLPQSIQQAAAQTQAAQPRLNNLNPATVTQTPGGNTAPQVINCATNPAGTGCNPQSTTTVGTTQSGKPVGGSAASTATTPTQPPVPLQPTPPPQPPPPMPVTITFAGLAKATSDPLGFTDQSANGRLPYTNGTLQYPVGQPQNGLFTATLSNGTSIVLPLPPGNSNAGGVNNAFGSFSAATFLSADQTFFYANAQSTTNPNQRGFIFGGTPVNQSFFQPTATNQFYTFNVQPDAALQAAIPFVPAQFGGNTPNAQVSPLLLVTAANNQFGAFSTTNQNVTSPRWLQSSIAFQGAGASQTSVFAVNTGDFFTSADTGTVVGSGPVRGSFQANGATPIRLGSGSATVPDGSNNNLFGANAITGFVLDQNTYNTSLNFNQQLASAVPLTQPATNYAFNQPVVAAGTPTVGSRTAQTTQGFFGGIMYPNVPGGTSPAPYILQGATGVVTDPTTNRVQAIFGGGDPFTGTQSGVRGITLSFGSLSGQSFARNTFIDDTRYAALESPSNPSTITNNSGATTTFPTTPGGTFTPRLGMVTSAVVNNALPNGVTPCACQYLQWGYWTGELDTPNANQTAAARIDRAHINTWFAGIPTAAADINTLQGQAFTGTYAGHVVGSVVNNGASYVAAGGFNGTYNFGTNVGTATISNFDGRTVAGSVIGSPGTGIYAGSFTIPGGNGFVSGRFFGPMAAETGGNFGIQATNYLASGIFAGKR